jgi:hypothetical protein
LKDVTTTSFGLIIAYLLPGLLGLYALSLWSPRILALLQSFKTAQSSIGLFFFVALIALIIGVEMTALRWAVFELLLCRGNRLMPEDFAGMTSDKAAAFNVAIDENYRYHQFFGAMTILLPILGISLAWKFGLPTIGLTFCWIAAFIIVEAITIGAAVEAYKRYVARARRILRGAA